MMLLHVLHIDFKISSNYSVFRRNDYFCPYFGLKRFDKIISNAVQTAGMTSKLWAVNFISCYQIIFQFLRTWQ